MPHRNKPKNMTCAVYARVSTTDQNCDMQLRELREYIKRRGWELASEYVDTGWSGAKKSRPALDKLMADAAQHRFDCVLVWKVDRFGRSVANLVDSLQQLATWGVRFISTSQSIDTDQANPTSKLMMHILAAVAEFEREMIRERVKAGMQAAKARGVKVGRRCVVFDRRRALDLHKKGQSRRQIARKLGVGLGTIHRLISAQNGCSTTPLSRPPLKR